MYNDGLPDCHLCYGKGESQGRGQKHPCSCLHHRIRVLVEGASQLGADLVMARAALGDMRVERDRLRASLIAIEKTTNVVGGLIAAGEANDQAHRIAKAALSESEER